jgi:ubiquitin C-terminal hydrolase
MKGLNNIGNSCYMNASLQLLLNIPEFYNLIYNNKNNLNEVNQFIAEYFSNSNSCNPSLIRKLINIYNNSKQHDSYEFLIHFFDYIDEKLPQNNKLSNIFGLKSKSSVKCKKLNCLTESNTYENHLFLSLPISTDLTTSYRLFKKKEMLNGENSFFCDKCKIYTVARKQLEMDNWPDNLIITYNRYSNSLNKLNNTISNPLEWRHGYNLVGGIIHSGSLNSGHYYYFGNYNGDWYEMNDSSVSKLSREMVNKYKNIAYILHYKKLSK